MTPNPCYKDNRDCPRRCVGCKTTCAEWQEWLEIHAQEKADIEQKRNNDVAVDMFFADQKKRVQRDNYRRGSKNYRSRR